MERGLKNLKNTWVINTSLHAAFWSDNKALKHLAPETIANAFLHREERKVNKSGCISFESKKYEAGLSFIGCKVNVIYDPGRYYRTY